MTKYTLITDHLGGIRFVVNVATGAIAQRIDYDEFGNVLLNLPAGRQVQILIFSPLAMPEVCMMSKKS